MEMNPEIHKSWKDILHADFSSDYFKVIKSYLEEDKAKGNLTYPLEKDIFNAFNLTPFNDVKVVIIGQDPYHGANQAHGLCFSVLDGVSHPPSLANIFKELHNDLEIPYPKSGNLENWAKQGVLLLNATLTVRESEANSHQGIGWKKFTDSVIMNLSDKRSDLIFLLWGGFAKKKGSKINSSNHHILTSGHPSPLSANRGYWYGNNHFSKTNEILKKIGKSPINWEIE